MSSASSQLRDAERVALANVALSRHNAVAAAENQARRMSARLVMGLSSAATIVAIYDMVLFLH